MKSLVLFNNKGGVGKTTLVFHIAHMASRQGIRTVVLDYDPQCNLSAFFLEEELLFELWGDGAEPSRTVSGCLELVRRGKGDVRAPSLTRVADGLWLLPGHLDLSRFEQTLAEEWPKTHSMDNERALDVTTALDLLSNEAAAAVDAELVLIDVGPSLGALNRAALLASDAVVVPMAPDLFSLQGLKNIGPTMREWRKDWRSVRRDRIAGRVQEALPAHDFEPLGYIVQQHLARSDRPVRGYERWARKIPAWFHEHVLGEESFTGEERVKEDPSCIALLKHFASLVPIAQLARKPLFDLKVADGIGGGQIQSVFSSRIVFEEIVREIMQRIGLTLDSEEPAASSGR